MRVEHNDDYIQSKQSQATSQQSNYQVDYQNNNQQEMNDEMPSADWITHHEKQVIDDPSVPKPTTSAGIKFDDLEDLPF